MKIQIVILPALSALLATACASPERSYPSLAIRDVERVTGTMLPAEPTPYEPPATPAAVDDKVERLSATAEIAHQGFLDELPDLSRTYATGRDAEPGSDAWAHAVVALGGLEAARNHTLIALADIDRLYVVNAIGGNDTSKIDLARTFVVALVEEEDRMIASITGTAR